MIETVITIWLCLLALSLLGMALAGVGAGISNAFKALCHPIDMHRYRSTRPKIPYPYKSVGIILACAAVYLGALFLL